MAAPFDMSMLFAPYVIYRQDPSDLGSPLVFHPPKDSDDLFDALRLKYPHIKTHAERMRDAVIEFLLDEYLALEVSTTTTMAAASTSMTTSPTDSTAFASSWEHSWSSMLSLSDDSTISSPATADVTTPLIGASPTSRPSLTGHGSHTAIPSAKAQTSPDMEDMTGMFSVSSAAQPRQHLRRKMTEAEKAEYRKRRIVRACEKCSKRKRKCVHNQPEMDNLTATSALTRLRPSPTSLLYQCPKAAGPQRTQATPSTAQITFSTETACSRPAGPAVLNFNKSGIRLQVSPRAALAHVITIFLLSAFTNANLYSILLLLVAVSQENLGLCFKSSWSQVLTAIVHCSIGDSAWLCTNLLKDTGSHGRHDEIESVSDAMDGEGGDKGPSRLGWDEVDAEPLTRFLGTDWPLLLSIRRHFSDGARC